MRASQLFFPTLREIPAEAELASHRLLLRGGFIRKLSAGVYSYLPLGYKVIKKVEKIIREETDAAGGQELLMPALQPAELWQETNRWEVDTLFKLKDRADRWHALGMTHEEVITDIVRHDVRSYRELPLNLYQIQTKFRDEPRPRGGVIRGREFIMLDSYTFDRNDEELDLSYRKMRAAFARSFARCGIDFLIVEAESGAIGGKDNQEFTVITPAGEDSILHCKECDYAANAERCEVADRGYEPSNEPAKPIQAVDTPGAKTVEQVTGFLKTKPENLVKTLIYVADGKPIAALVRGDRELNEAKFSRNLDIYKLEMAGPELILELTGAEVGFSGPVGLKGVRIVADYEVRSMANFVTGANKTDTHYVNVNIGRDFNVDEWADIKVASDQDPCPRCEGVLQAERGIEVGHIFKLGTKYSEAMGATFLDEDGKEKPFIMGCYGLGVSRMLAAVSEARRDDDGIIWPVSIAPFEVVILLLNPLDEAQAAAAVRIYEELQNRGIDVLLDERDERSGVKFKDADLIGIPVQVVVGRLASEGKVEMRLRWDKQNKREVALNEATDEIAAAVQAEKRKLLDEADKYTV
ncbi:MAG TPA: proline--tRNA ligase [Armatimonadota bacterium]|nr:proline--tRNA ligase [Armatimonadota bacterium]